MDAAPAARMFDARRAIIAGLGAVLLIATAVVMLAAYLPASPTTDLRIYREGILAFVHGQDVYQTGFGSDHHYAFTYPTPSLIIFLPLSAISLGAARVAIWALSATALLIVVNLSLARTGLVTDRAYRWAAVATISAGALWIEPVRSTFWLGQANLLLLGLVVVDCLAVRTWLPRGALIGLATAIKLTPGIFIVYLALTGQRRAAATSAGVFTGAAGLAFAIAPTQSWEYWTHYLFDARRVGRTTYVANQSLRGLLGRAYHSMHPPGVLWLALAAIAAIGGLYLVVRAHQRGDVLLGASLAGVTGLLVSPISWNHHWVWVVPLLIALAARAWPRGVVGTGSGLQRPTDKAEEEVDAIAHRPTTTVPAGAAARRRPTGGMLGHASPADAGRPRPWAADAVPTGWLGLTGGLTALFYLAPLWWVEHDAGDLRYSPHGFADVVYADSYLLGGVLVLALVPVLTRARSGRGLRPRREPTMVPAGRRSTPSSRHYP